MRCTAQQAIHVRLLISFIPLACTHLIITCLGYYIDMEEEGKSIDWLYKVIEHIITTHNGMINDVYSTIERKGHFLKRFLPEKPSKISITAVSTDQTIVGSTNGYVYVIYVVD